MKTFVLSYKESSKYLYEFHQSAQDSYLNLYTDRKKDATYIWLFDEQTIVGFLSYIINEILDSTKAFIYVVKVYILKKFRGNNLSHILFNKISQIEDEKRKLDINVITLVAANKQLEDKLYRKIGFKELINESLLELYSKIIRTQDPIMYKLKKPEKFSISDEELEFYGARQ
jgi:ribosomal protein S18 acetylase RimI-like enzyme